jgi:hypothetical protein
MDDAKALDQHALREFLIAELRERVVKADLVKVSHAQGRKRARPLLVRLQAEGRSVRLKHVSRVWLEHRDAQRRALDRSRGARRGYNGLVANMNAVEVPERDRCASGVHVY